MSQDGDIDMVDVSADDWLETACIITNDDDTDVEMTDVDVESEAPEEEKDTAVSRVLQTTELLEMVLLNCSMPQLFVIQRTCKTFRDTIQHSPWLQWRMFLGRSSPKNVKAIEWDGVRPAPMNPLLRNTFFVPRVMAEVGMLDGFHATKLAKHFLKTRRLDFTRKDEADFGSAGMHHLINLDRRDGSWRRMCVARVESLPPTHSQIKMQECNLSILISRQAPVIAGYHRRYVTLGEVIDAVETAYELYWIGWKGDR